jgi:hypothetical protein
MSRPLARVDYVFSRKSLKMGHIKFAGYAAIILAAVYVFYTLFTQGIPLLTGMSRVDYLQRAGLLEQKLIFYVSPIAFLLGFYRKKGRWFSSNGFIISIFVIFAILVGNKFSLLVTMLVSYYTPVFIRFLASDPGRRLFTGRRVFGLMMIISIFILMTLAAYFHVFRNISYSYNLLVNRIFAFQGQMWWAVDYDVSHDGRYDQDHWQVELDNIVSPGDTRQGEVGMKYLMVKVLGPQKAFSIFERGYLYTYTYPAILIATFPESIAVPLQFLAGLLFAAILYYLYYSILYRHALRALITMLVVMPYLAMIFSGNFATFFTAGMAVKLAILMLLESGARNQEAGIEPAMP